MCDDREEEEEDEEGKGREGERKTGMKQDEKLALSLVVVAALCLSRTLTTSGLSAAEAIIRAVRPSCGEGEIINY